MLEAETIAIGILAGWILFGIGITILLRIRGEKLPAGSVVIERSDDVELQVTSTRRVKFGVLFAMGGCILVSVVFVVSVLLGLWSLVSSYFSVNLPNWMNWIGLVGIWVHLAWGVAVMYYNVNYLPITKPIPNRYVLATGGPYRIVRHPMYFDYIILNISLFFATGLWILGVVALGWLTLRRQMMAEEATLHIMFGEVYDEYLTRTGQLFPWM